MLRVFGRCNFFERKESLLDLPIANATKKCLKWKITIDLSVLKYRKRDFRKNSMFHWLEGFSKYRRCYGSEAWHTCFERVHTCLILVRYTLMRVWYIPSQQLAQGCEHNGPVAGARRPSAAVWTRLSNPTTPSNGVKTINWSTPRMLINPDTQRRSCKVLSRQTSYRSRSLMSF